MGRPGETPSRFGSRNHQTKDAMLASLILPVVLAAIALFFASFLSWMIVKLHRRDWVKIDKEDEFMEAARGLDIKEGSYMFPHCDDPEKMKSEEFQKKQSEGPIGVITIFSKPNMKRNLGLTFLYFLVISFCLAYLTSLTHERGAEFFEIFHFVSVAGVMTYLSAIICHAIWFQGRILGHIVESVVYAAITGAIFGALWPGTH